MRLLVLMSFLALVACNGEIAVESQAEANAADSNSAEPAAENTSEAKANKPDIQTEEITYEAGDTVLNGYIAYDASVEEKRPGVLVVHEWWGLNEYARTRAHMLAQMGYTALALDMYGDGKVATHPEDAQKFMTEATENMEALQARFSAAEEVLRQHPTTDSEKIAAVGYCFGGAVVLNMARQGADLEGVASFHGALATETPAQEGDIQADILVLHGEEDPMVPPDQVEAFEEEMDAADADYRVITYPDAVHSFTNPGATAVGEKFDMPLAYNESADEQSWMELEQFLANVFAEE